MATAPPGDGDYAITLAPYACAAEEKTISLAKDVLVVVRKVLDSGWVYVVVLHDPQKAGYFPVSYLKKLSKEEALGSSGPPPVTSPAPPIPAIPPVSSESSAKPTPPATSSIISPRMDSAASGPPPVVPRKESLARSPLPPVVSPKPGPVHVASSIGASPAANALPGSPSFSHSPVQPIKVAQMQSRTNLAPPTPAAAPPSASSKDISHLALGEAVANVNSRFQDYVMYQSRLINKFRASLEAQSTLMDANNDLAICIHEYGKKLAGDDCQTVGEGNLGACMMKISEVLLSLERLKCQQRTLEQEVVQHFLDFVNVSAPNIRKQKNAFDLAQQEYLDASLRLREMGMKAKVKLENVKQAETEKAEKKTVYHSTTASLLENLKILLHEENATLLSHFSNWMDTLNESTSSTQRNLSRDMAFVRLWKDAASTESQLKLEEKGKAAQLLQNFEGETSSLKEQLIMLSSKSSVPMKAVGGDPVQKLLDSLVRDERKYVHRIAAVQNIYMAELKKEAGLLPPEDEKKIFLNIAEIVDFHTRFLKSLEKAFNCWPFPHLAGLFLDSFKPDVFASYGEYIGKLGSSRSFLKKMRQKKDQWRSICKSIQQRHDIEALGDLIMLPQNRLEKYIKFLSDYLELIPETEPDYNPASDTLLHFEECFDDINATPSRSEVVKITGIDLNVEEEVKETHRQFIYKGNAEVKAKDSNVSANFLYLCSDQLVICQKRVEADSKSKTPQYVASLYLSDLIIKPVPENQKVVLSTPDNEYTCTFADSKEKKMWVNYLTRAVEERERRYKLFGVPLKVVMRREKDRSIPKFMQSALEAILHHKESEGIFRLSGTQRIIKQAIHDLNQGKRNVFPQMDEHSIAGVLKQFFRDLPEPLLTWDLYDEFVNSVRNVSEVSEKMELISVAIEKLPRGNRLVLLFLIKALFEVAAKEPVNKMSAHNLAIVFGPNLLRSKASHLDLTDYSAPVVEVMIAQYLHLFPKFEKEFEKEFGSADSSKVKQMRLNDYRRSYAMVKSMNLDEAKEEEAEVEGDDEEDEGEEFVDTNANLGAVVKEGWLQKKGEKRRNWTKRWFVLKYGSLAYFKTQDGVNAAGRIILVDCLVGQSTSKKTNCFAITTPTKRTFLLTAANPREQAEWMQAIQSCIESSF